MATINLWNSDLNSWASVPCKNQKTASISQQAIWESLFFSESHLKNCLIYLICRSPSNTPLPLFQSQCHNLTVPATWRSTTRAQDSRMRHLQCKHGRQLSACRPTPAGLPNRARRWEDLLDVCHDATGVLKSPPCCSSPRMVFPRFKDLPKRRAAPLIVPLGH